MYSQIYRHGDVLVKNKCFLHNAVDYMIIKKPIKLWWGVYKKWIVLLFALCEWKKMGKINQKKKWRKFTGEEIIVYFGMIIKVPGVLILFDGI